MVRDTPTNAVELDALADTVAVVECLVVVQGQHLGRQHLQLQRHGQAILGTTWPNAEEHLPRDEQLASGAALLAIEVGEPFGIGLVGPAQPQPLHPILEHRIGNTRRGFDAGAHRIAQASNGRQYMIPGDNGSVISNKDLTGGGSGLVIYNNVSNYTSSNVTTTATDNGDGSVTIDTIVADISENGPIGQAISRNYTANRRATE